MFGSCAARKDALFEEAFHARPFLRLRVQRRDHQRRDHHPQTKRILNNEPGATPIRDSTLTKAKQRQSKTKHSKAKQNRAKQSKAKQSKAKQSKAKQSRAKQSKGPQGNM